MSKPIKNIKISIIKQLERQKKTTILNYIKMIAPTKKCGMILKK